MPPSRVAVLLCLGLAGLPGPLQVQAQARAVTLADAIRLSERVQPTVVRAAGDVETAAAQRRNAWAAYLPALTASSSAGEFFSEGPSRIDPVTGQVLTGNSTNRSLNTSLSASVDLFTGFRRGAEMRAARAGQSAAEASLVDARFQQALTTTNQFLDALAAQQLVRVRESSVRRAEEQLKTSIAKLRAGSATRSDSLRSLVTLGNARLELMRAGTDLATRRGGARPADRRDGPGAGGGRLGVLPGHGGARHRGHPHRGRSEEPPHPERRRRRRPPPGKTSRRRAPPTGPASRSRRGPRGMPAAPTTMICSTSGRSASACAGTCSTASTGSWRSPSGRRASTWPRRPRPTSGARWGRS